MELINSLINFMARSGWTSLMTGTLLAAIGMIIANIVVIYFFVQRLKHERTDETSFALRRNKFWIFFLIRYTYIAGIILLTVGTIIAFAIFGTSVADNAH